MGLSLACISRGHSRCWVLNHSSLFYLYVTVRDRTPRLGSKGDEVLQAALVRACQGLPQGEIELILERELAFASSCEEMARGAIDHKVNKLRGGVWSLLPSQMSRMQLELIVKPRSIAIE